MGSSHNSGHLREELEALWQQNLALGQENLELLATNKVLQ